jgi:hypothetical protein
MGRPRLENKQQQLTVALPPETRIHLTETARAEGRSIAEEVRQRLNKTIEWDKLDPVTVELIEGLERIATLLRTDFGAEWHDNPRAHEAFVTAVNQRLGAYAPPPEQLRTAASELFGPLDPPETVGRLRERDDWQRHQYGFLIAGQKQRVRHDFAPLVREVEAAYNRAEKAKQESNHD